MIELVKVVRLKSLSGYRLWLEFSNGAVGARDFADMIADGGVMVEPLRDEAFCARAFVQNGVPAWPNGLDLDAIALLSGQDRCRVKRSLPVSLSRAG